MNDEILQYIEGQKKLYKSLINFIDANPEDEPESENFKKLISIFQDQKIGESKEELKQFLTLIAAISLRHHRNANFFELIEQILTNFEQPIKKFFTDSELFEIFFQNMRLLLFFISQQMIGLGDKDIQQFISEKPEAKQKLFNIYFFNEMKPFIEEQKVKQIEIDVDKNDFDKKRQIGENDSYVCQLIREDSVKEFIIYVNKTNLNLSSEVNMSYFETNYSLIGKKTTLIEYAAYFGSIQIFRYLIQNKVDLDKSIWNFAIHGRNPEMIHLLEELTIQSELDVLIKESLLCHHNELAEYFLSETDNANQIDKFIQNILYAHNYSYFPKFTEINDTFILFCFFNYFTLVKLLLKTKEIDLNHKYSITKLII